VSAPCDRLVVAFDVDIRPQPKRRARHGQGRTYSDPRTVAYENAIGIAARAEMAGEPVEGDVALWCLFEQRDARRCDGDNAYKAIADALNGIAYLDDRQVVDGRFHTIHRADRDRVSVAVLRIEETA
jgi:Holliday junction resolvase RusA-like endonuclease